MFLILKPCPLKHLQRMSTQTTQATVTIDHLTKLTGHQYQLVTGVNWSHITHFIIKLHHDDDTFLHLIPQNTYKNMDI